MSVSPRSPVVSFDILRKASRQANAETGESAMRESVEYETGNVPHQRHATNGQNGYLVPVPNDASERGAAFAALIREARHRAGLTQEDIFGSGVVSKSTLVRWESGRAERPDPDQVRELCQFLHIDPTEAAIALGYLTREDVRPPAGEAIRDPAVLRAIEALEDPRLSGAEKERWVEYLEYLRDRARRGDDPRRATG